MPYQRNPINEEEFVSERDYLTSVLNVVNGYCKINLVVPQTSLFYKSDSLLPINAKHPTLNNTVDNSKLINTSDNFTSIINNFTNIKVDEHVEYLNAKPSSLSEKMSADELQEYSKPSFSDNCDSTEKKDDLKKNITTREKKRKKYTKVDIASTSFDNPNLDSYTGISKNLNTSNEFGNEKFKDSGLQKQEHQKNQMKNSMYMSKSLPSYESKNKDQSDVSHKSQCPLCFKFFPTPVIEAHASGCSI